MLRLVTDENIHGDIVSGIRRQQLSVDIVVMQEVGLRTVSDETLLEWAAAEGRIIISVDRNTLIGLALERVSTGLPMPGVFIIRPTVTVGKAIEAITLLALASDPDEWKDRVTHLPL